MGVLNKRVIAEKMLANINGVFSRCSTTHLAKEEMTPQKNQKMTKRRHGLQNTEEDILATINETPLQVFIRSN